MTTDSYDKQPSTRCIHNCA